jgi:micrococcal nuclease
LLFVLLLPLRSFAGREPATIVRAVDGDTLEVSLNGHPEKVRLIGVDTPEVHESEKLHRDSVRTHQDEATIKALGQRAWDFTKSLVHAGDQVQLEYGQEPRDRYHRVLAFVWLPDGRMLNETIICEGYANALTRYPFRSDYMERFRACERQAREQGKGLWAAEGLREAPVAKPPSQVSTTVGDVIRGNKRSKIYHLPGCPDYSHISVSNIVEFRTEQDALQAGYRRAKNCR